jgi:AraC-like DNA-binding protein
MAVHTPARSLGAESHAEIGPRSQGLAVRVFRDSDEIATMTRGESKQSYLQLSAGRFLGSTTRLVAGDVRLHWTTLSGRTLSRFRLHEKWILYSIPVFADALTVNGHAFARPVLVQRVGDDEHVRHAKDCGYVSMAVPRERFTTAAAALAQVEPEDFRLPTAKLCDTGAAARRLRGALETFGRTAARDPSLLERVDVREAIRTRVEDAVLDHLVEQFGRRDEKLPPPGSRIHVVRRAERYLEEAGGRPVPVAELCRAAGTSRRSLEYVFQAVYGVSPLRYMQARRLAHARRLLREGPPERGEVKRAAYEAGFTEMGRFSVYYRRFFGESPSATLAG